MKRIFLCQAWLLLCIFIASSFSSFSQSPSPGVSAPGDGFSFVASSAESGSPEVAEWTRTAGPDESIVLTGYKFSRFSGVEEGKDSRFMIYGSGGIKKEAKIQRLDGDKAILTLDKDLPSWSMYLLQPGNDAGYGKPIAINKTDAWWVQDKAAVGMTASVFGRNLAHGNVEGSSNSHVYLKSSATGAGQWASVTKVNPYKVDFTLPSSITAGNYEVWVHNGHGGEWGWSGPLKLQVVASSEHVLTKNWGASVFNVKNYGAKGDGQSDDRGAINQALAAAGVSGATVYFPAGTYMVSGSLNLCSNTRWEGQVDGSGKPSSIIKLRNGFVGGAFGLMGGNSMVNWGGTYDLMVNSFENLKFDRNGQSVGESILNMRNARMMKWYNCDIDGRGADGMRFSTAASHVYLLNTSFTGGANQWGNVVYMDGVRQFFVDGCNFRFTNDCEAALKNVSTMETSVTNCFIKDLDPTTTDGSGWGKGRIWSAQGNRGSGYHQYFGGNQGTGLGVRMSGSNLPDNNSGEIFLWEINIATFRGYAGSATSTTVNFGASVPVSRGSDGLRKDIVVAVIEGKGAGQFRRVVAQNGGQLTLDRPWQLQPDGSSLIMAGPFVERVVVYKNSMDANGKDYIAQYPPDINGRPAGTASAGVEPYGGCFDFVVDGNIMKGLRRGITNWATQHGSDKLDPGFFHLMVNNKMTGCRFGIYNGTPNIESNIGTALLGAVYRRNIAERSLVSSVQNDLRSVQGAIFKAFVYEHNDFTGAPLGFQTGSMYQQDGFADYGSNALENQVFYKNNFGGALSTTAIRITPKTVLRENKYQGFSSLYKGTLAAEVEAPYHVVEIQATPGGAVVKTPFTILNSGTATMTWTATSNVAWLKLSTLTGTILHEGESNSIELTTDPKNLAEGTYKGYITISTLLGQSEIYTILLKVGNAAAQPSAPTIALTSPTSGSNFTAPTTIALTADASDADGSITKVEFFNGTTKLGEDLSAPYSFSWSNVAAGTYTITAKATDNGGLSTTSQGVNISVADNVNLAPSSELTSPTEGSNFTAPATIALTANASDAGGSITKVEFFNGTTKLGEDLSAPYSLSWSNVAPGTYTITAKATDNGGLSTTSQGVNISIADNVNLAPSSELTSPTEGSDFTAPATIALTADASDADGLITKVEFFNGSTKIGEVNTAPYIFSWNDVSAGNYTITAKATDNGGLSTTSQGVNISIADNVNLAPSIELTSPTEGSNFTAPATIALTADALDADGSITKVEFFNGSTKIGEDNTAPYSFSWNDVSSGNYTITAKATDNGGLSTTSQAVSITASAAIANIAPIVKLTSPSAGSNFTAPATIALTADASDADGSIAKVEFFNGTTKLGEDLSAPYSFSWSNVAAGTYTITAKATDNGGLTITSQSVDIIVSIENANIAPAVKLTSPSTGSNFTSPATINITAEALDADGSITKVEFFNGSTKIGEDNTAPYNFSWNDVSAGNYTITAKATDNGGLNVKSQTVHIKVKDGSNIAPTVKLTSPSAGSNFTAPATISLTADALDADGSITKVEFFNGSTKIGEDLTAPYSFSWNDVTAGNYTITAKATDNGGLSTTSQGVSITASAAIANIAPTVKLTSPSAGSNFTAPATIALTADASDADGSIAKVEFFNGSTKIGEDNTAPYNFSWNDVSSGNYTITAKATDNGGLSTTSQSVSITASAAIANIAPIVKLTSPSAGSNFTAPATIALTADASDADGSITKVEFFNGSTKIGEDLTAPYSFSWNDVSSGNYTITAKATDNGGLSTTSQAVSITASAAIANIAPTVKLTSPSAGSNFTAPATIALTADASDADGSITKVEFFNGTTKIGEDNTAPYSFSWNDVSSGNYTITARATDNGGLTIPSQSVGITVNNYSNIAPTVKLTSPSGGSYFTTPVSITLTADASDKDGSIVTVEFFSGSTKIGEDNTAPYIFSWNNVNPGTYTITARTTDNSGFAVISQGITIAVSEPQPLAPIISLTSLTRGTFTAPSNISLTAEASDADGSITKVEFFNGATKIGESLTAPYSFIWNNVPAGIYFIVAWATDNSGMMAVSQPMEIIVNKPNEGPTVKITSPTSGNAIFSAPASITFYTQASDADGSVVKVEFFNGTNKLGESTDKPFNFTWADVVAGSYSITAKAIDNNGATTTSSVVSLIVSDPGKLRNYPNPVISRTTFEFSLPRESYVELQVFTVEGVKVATPFKGIVEKAAIKQIEFDSAGLPGGTYFCRLIYNDGVSFFKDWLETKMVIVK